jgi:hypothetical protein
MTDPPPGPRGVLAAAALGLVVLSSVWPGFVSPNEYSRVYAARARVLAGSWAIDGELAAHGWIEDVARFGGRFYSNKPPGLIWLAVPVVAALHAVHPGASPALDLYATRLALVSLAALGAAALLARWLRERRVGGSDPAGAALLLLLATPYGVYAGVFFSHAFVGACLLAAVYLLSRDGPGLDARLAAAGAGLCAGLAVVSEYSIAPAAGLALLAGAARAPRRLPWLALGALAPLAGLLRYNATCFGTPFTLSNRHDAYPAYAELGRELLFGFGAPSLEALSGLLVSPARGLLFLAPFLAPALLAPVRLWRGVERALAVSLAAALWLQPLALAGYPNWQGGAAFGPRYLVACLPLWVLALATVRLGARARVLVAGAGLAAGLVHLLARATPPFALAGEWSDSVLRGWTLPALAEGLWNRPFGVDARAPALTALLGVSCLQAAVLAHWWWRRARAEGARAAAAGLAVAALALALQLGLGGVREDQRRWLERWQVVALAGAPAPPQARSAERASPKARKAVPAAPGPARAGLEHGSFEGSVEAPGTAAQRGAAERRNQEGRSRRRDPLECGGVDLDVRAARGQVRADRGREVRARGRMQGVP